MPISGRWQQRACAGPIAFVVALLLAGMPGPAGAQGQGAASDAPGSLSKTAAGARKNPAASGSQNASPPQIQLPDGLNVRLAPKLSARVPPLTSEQRIGWSIKSTIGFEGLAAGAVSAGVGTWLGRPREDGQDWAGFGQRYGMRLTGIAPSNLAEAEIGALWGEDPRYFRVPDRPFLLRLRHVVRMTFEAPRADGRIEPAYARYIGITGTNFLSNVWRPPSEANTQAALERSAIGLLGRMGSNAFHEFWPDVWRWFRRK